MRSMANYDAGLITKSKIYDSCKELFYEKGYKDTTYKDIQSYSAINPSLINYYFKSKKNIAGLVYADLLKDVKELVKSYMLENLGHYELQYGTTLEHIIFLQLFYHDDNLKKFYYDLCSDSILLEVDSEKLTDFYELHNKTYDLNLSHHKITLIQIANVSISQGLTTKYFEGYINTSVEEYIAFRTENMYRMMGISQERIEEISKNAWEIYNGMDVKFEKYFKIELKSKSNNS